MSENQEFEKEGLESMAVIPTKGETVETPSESLKSVDGQSYFLGEVPQSYLMDPAAFLPLNSDRLVGSVNVLEQLMGELGQLIQDEVNLIQKFQKKIAFWEDRIEKNKAIQQKHLAQIKQNNIDAIYDRKNRDYWLTRAEEVEIDYSHAEVANRSQDWAWLIKKYGLKNADGSEISATNSCVDELCNGETNNLIAEYRAAGQKYENARKDKETENNRMIRENAKMQNGNELLQSYIAATYANDVEPLQDGVLLFKELNVKLKSLAQEGNQATYGDLRAWAETFLNDFIKANPRVPQSVVTEFRKLTSIPLPADHA